ncbi:MAG: hypothetical protein V3T23_01955 [Nitrososphaerales archaeon]
MQFTRGPDRPHRFKTLVDREVDRIKKGDKEVVAWLIADLHLHHLPSWRLQWCQDFMDDMHVLREEWVDGKPWFVFMGDVFEMKDRLDARVADQFLSFVCQDDNAAWITGQHDTYVPGKATLGGLRYSMFVVDGKSSAISMGDWLAYTVPFARDLGYYRQMLDSVPDDALVLTHMPIYESLQQFHPDPDTMVHAKEFDRFFWTYAGDIHNHQTHGRFTYIGAPSQRDWRDQGVDGKIGVLYADKSFERISVQHPVHIKIRTETHVNQLLQRQSIEVPTVYKIIGDIEPSKLELIKDIDGVLGVEWIPPELSTDRPIEELKIEGLGSDKDLIDDYIASSDLPEGLSKELVLEAGLGLCDSKD